MKIKVNKYILKNPKIKENKVILNLSDIHSNLKALNAIIKLLDKIKIDYILIPGDIVDILNLDNEKEFLDGIIKLSNYAKTYITIGNHDKYISKRKMCDMDIFKNSYFYNTLKDKPNIFFFCDTFNTISIDDNIDISSINLPNSYYKEKEKGNIFNNCMNEIDNKYKLNTDKFNILLSHTPNPLIKKKRIINYSTIINDTNLILCGHNHGGLTPTWIQDLFNGHTGFVGPYTCFIQRNAYGIWTDNNKNILISNGVTKLSQSAPLRFLHKMINGILIPEIDLIYLENDLNNSFNLIERKKHKMED